MEKKIKSPDIIIIGGGVAGLTAALYAGRMNLDTLILESDLLGGQIINAHAIENYPGFASIKGSELVEKIQEQAESFGAVIDEFDPIEKVSLKPDKKVIETSSFLYEPKAVIIASGMMRRKLALPGSEKYNGKGIHYCELCDGHMYQGRDIVVVGGGNAGIDAANFLTKYARKLYVITHSEQWKADKSSLEKLQAHEKVEFITQADITALSGQDVLEEITLRDKVTQQERKIAAAAIFVNIGVTPNTHLFAGDISFDEERKIIAGEDCQTNVAGVFAAGDVRTKLVRQLTTAAADGTVAALLAEKYIQKLKEEA